MRVDTKWQTVILYTVHAKRFCQQPSDGFAQSNSFAPFWSFSESSEWCSVHTLRALFFMFRALSAAVLHSMAAVQWDLYVHEVVSELSGENFLYIFNETLNNKSI